MSKGLNDLLQVLSHLSEIETKKLAALANREASLLRQVKARNHARMEQLRETDIRGTGAYYIWADWNQKQTAILADCLWQAKAQTESQKRALRTIMAQRQLIETLASEAREAETRKAKRLSENQAS